MWKKTGAWFYKGLPTYELPQRSNSSNNNNKIVSNKHEDDTPDKVPKTTKLGMTIEESSEEEEVETVSRMSVRQGKSFFGLKLANGATSRNIEEARKSPMSPYSRQTSSSESQRSCSYSQLDWDLISRNRSGSTAMSTTNLRRGSVSSSFSLSDTSSGNDSAIGGVNQGNILSKIHQQNIA